MKKKLKLVSKLFFLFTVSLGMVNSLGIAPGLTYNILNM